MATLLKVLNNLADIKSAGGVALRVRTQALRGFGLRLFGDRPNEARKLARNRGGDHGLQFPCMGELAISTAESLLGLPGYVSDWLAQLFLAQKEIATDKCWET